MLRACGCADPGRQPMDGEGWPAGAAGAGAPGAHGAARLQGAGVGGLQAAMGAADGGAPGGPMAGGAKGEDPVLALVRRAAERCERINVAGQLV